MTELAERHDIQNREGIARLVETFYRRAFADPVLGRIFIDVVQMDLEAHMPIMCDFWENILCGARKYPGGMMMVHFRVHAKTSLEPHRGGHGAPLRGIAGWTARWAEAHSVLLLKGLPATSTRVSIRFVLPVRLGHRAFARMPRGQPPRHKALLA